MAIYGKTEDGTRWVKVYNAGGTSRYEPVCGGSWLSFWKNKKNWPKDKLVTCSTFKHEKENESNTQIDGGHVRFVGENGHDLHLVTICHDRNVQVEEGKEKTEDWFWVRVDMVYDLQPGDSKLKED